MKGRDLISIKELSQKEILSILEQAETMKREPPGSILKGFLLASCFFEPSTRTRLSFEAAMKRLGGEVIGFSDRATTSTEKGESISDTMRVMGSYADCIVIRHPLEGSARLAAEATSKPVINGGDGANEHPTQTLIDLFTIKECQGKLEGLNIVFMGDLKQGRTVHSLALALRHFRPRLFFVSPPTLGMPEAICESLKTAGIPFSFHTTLDEVIERADVLYMTRIQRERFSSQSDYEKVKEQCVLNSSHLERAKETLKILHPLPRVHEIAKEIDESRYAHYFTQAENGLYVRQALLAMTLKGEE